MTSWSGRRSLTAMTVGILFLSACGESPPPQPDVRVEGAWVRAVAGPEANSAAYMNLRNDGDAPDRLTGARAGIARMTELHRTTIDEAGMARMGEVEALDLPAGSAAQLEPGGYHLMLMGVGTLTQGDTVEITLELEVSNPVHVRAEVRPF